MGESCIYPLVVNFGDWVLIARNKFPEAEGMILNRVAGLQEVLGYFAP